MVDVVDGWGVDGVLERAPELPGLEIAAAEDPFLDAMARYQVCNLLLALQLEDPAYREDMNIRITSVFGLSAVTGVERLAQAHHGQGDGGGPLRPASAARPDPPAPGRGSSPPPGPGCADAGAHAP